MQTSSTKEVIFVGLPGPTHHYGGLSRDNVASEKNRGNSSSPKEAALQVLDLMRLMISLGEKVAILPPLLRPHMPLLRQHFEGSNDAVIRAAALEAPELLEQACSSSSMWCANAATVSPVFDTKNSHLHITTANLFSNLHRRIEAEDTHYVLQQIFAEVPDCTVHMPLSAAAGMHDEGAANHMRFAPTHDAKGVEVFVYGADGSTRDPQSARQSLLASQEVMTAHQLPSKHALLVRQNPHVITQGVFHNDVIAVGHLNCLLAHELAFDAGAKAFDQIGAAYKALHKDALHELIISEDDLSIEEAVHSYLFNSQIIGTAVDGMSIIAPQETEELFEGKAMKLLEALCARGDNPIRNVYTADLRQSMRNGGGPACLRLRVVMRDDQLEALTRQRHVCIDAELLEGIEETIHNHYPDHLTPQSLGNPLLYTACENALKSFSELMDVRLLRDA